MADGIVPIFHKTLRKVLYQILHQWAKEQYAKISEG
jgi:hypothetical protein